MTRQTTNPDGNFRDRSSQLPVSNRVCLITGGEITVSIALNINSASNVGVIKEKSFSSTSFSIALLGEQLSLYLVFALNREVLEAIRQLQPRVFTLENVPCYQNSQSFSIILQVLESEGYLVDYSVVTWLTSDYSRHVGSYTPLLIERVGGRKQ
ncbi:MAG: DNA cytosine methyltransferase [Nostoc sp.]|uniref:DNA cytosine methyltransferase n=1 Tax=Nostoc sp. TaxID=1180 RepID=UPI002FFD2260